MMNQERMLQDIGGGMNDESIDGLKNLIEDLKRDKERTVGLIQESLNLNKDGVGQMSQERRIELQKEAERLEQEYDRKIDDLHDKLEDAEEKYRQQQEENDLQLGYVASQYNKNLHSAAHQGRIQAIKAADNEKSKMQKAERKRREEYRKKLDSLNKQNYEAIDDLKTDMKNEMNQG